MRVAVFSHIRNNREVSKMQLQAQEGSGKDLFGAKLLVMFWICSLTIEAEI